MSAAEVGRWGLAVLLLVVVLAVVVLVLVGGASVATRLARRLAGRPAPAPPGPGARRPGRAPAGRAPAGRALVVVGALAAGLVVVGAPSAGASGATGHEVLAAPYDCKAPPDPDRPGTGLVGSLDPAPIGVGTPGSVYDEVGYAGQVWWTYDLGCGPGGARDPAAATDTWLGNQVFNVAKLIVGGVNWAHYLIERGSGLLAPLDGVIRSGTQAMYGAVFTTWVGVALLVLAAILLLLAMRGDLSRQAQRGGVAVIALAVAAGAYAAPVQWSRALDGVLLDGVTAMQDGFLSQIGAGDVHTLPTVLTDTVVYNNWLRGQFGSADVPQAREMGRDLLRAQTFTKREVQARQDGQSQADAKKQQYTDIANRVGDRYSYFQGRQGSRTGAGVLALVQASCVGLFQFMSKLLILVSMLLIRLIVMVAPALAVLALLQPAVLPATLRVGGAALVNTVLVGALAGLHALLVVALFRPGSGIDIWLALLVTGVVTVLMWAVARPFRRLASMMALTRDQVSGFLPGAGTGALGRVLARGQDTTRQDSWWDERRASVAGASSSAGWRPEYSASARPGASPGGAGAPAPVHVDSERVPPRRTPGDPVALPGARRALPAGSGAASAVPPGAGGPPGDRDAVPARARTSEADRTLYRRVAERAGPRRPVEAEIVDGAPVYRIYRPSPPVAVSSSHDPGGSRADPD